MVTQDGFRQLHQMTKGDADGQKAKDVSNKTLADQGKAWTNLNHSVVLLGWG